VKDSQIIGLVAGILLAAGYIALHMMDARRRAKAATEGKFQLPFSPLAMIARLTLVVVIVVVVLRIEAVDKFWFVGTFAAVYTVFFVWELQDRWKKKK